MLMKKYILIRKSTLFCVLAAVAGGLLLYCHYAKSGRSLKADAQDFAQNSAAAAAKGKNVVKNAVEDAKK